MTEPTLSAEPTILRPAPDDPPEAASVGALVARMSEQTSRLIHDELRLAQLEMTEKGKKAGIGVSMFGVAGLIAVFGLACFVAAAVLGLAGPLSPWLAAVIVGVVLLVIAGIRCTRWPSGSSGRSGPRRDADRSRRRRETGC